MEFKSTAILLIFRVRIISEQRAMLGKVATWTEKDTQNGKTQTYIVFWWLHKRLWKSPMCECVDFHLFTIVDSFVFRKCAI